jgi:hypothetical protein
VFADRRYQRHDKRDKLPGWITTHLREAHLNLSTDMLIHVARDFMRSMAQVRAHLMIRCARTHAHTNIHASAADLHARLSSSPHTHTHTQPIDSVAVGKSLLSAEVVNALDAGGGLAAPGGGVAEMELG